MSGYLLCPTCGNTPILETMSQCNECEREAGAAAPWRIIHGLSEALEANGQPVDVAALERIRERDAARAQLRVCIDALEDEAAQLEQWATPDRWAPSPQSLRTRADVLRRVADVARRAKSKLP